MGPQLEDEFLKKYLDSLEFFKTLLKNHNFRKANTCMEVKDNVYLSLFKSSFP